MIMYDYYIGHIYLFNNYNMDDLTTVISIGDSTLQTRTIVIVLKVPCLFMVQKRGLEPL